MKPFIFKKVREDRKGSFWLVNISDTYETNYALLINNDVIRIVEVNFKSQDNMETSIFRDIISLSTEDDLKKLLREFSRLRDEEIFSIKEFYNFIDYIKEEKSIEEKGNSNENEMGEEKRRFFLFLSLIYEYIYNRELKYSMPLWFRNSFLIKAISLKVKYKFLKDFINRNKNNNKEQEKEKKDEHELNFINICIEWLTFCLDNWRINLNYPPLLENFPEGEVNKILDKENFLKCQSWKGGSEDEGIKEQNDLNKRILTFFLRRYDMKNAIRNLIVCVLPIAYNLSNFLSYSLIGVIISLFIGFSLYPKPTLLLALLLFILIMLYYLFLKITQRIFFPRALFGSTVAWTILSSTTDVKNLPQRLCNGDCKFGNCELYSYIVFILIFIISVVLYIISEMDNFIKDLPFYKKLERSFILFVFIYSITFEVGFIFFYNLILHYSFQDVLKYLYLTSIATFMSIAAQILWEDKPITEV